MKRYVRFHEKVNLKIEISIHEEDLRESDDFESPLSRFAYCECNYCLKKRQVVKKQQKHEHRKVLSFQQKNNKHSTQPLSDVFALNFLRIHFNYSM